jgi:hypothetical protein
MLAWIIGGIICLLLLVGIEVLHKRNVNRGKQLQSVELNSRVEGLGYLDTIFVVLPMYRPHAEILNQLFEAAYCPQRIFVGILEHKLPNVTSSIDAYTRELHGKMTPSFIRNIRYREGRLDGVYGSSVARQEIVSHLYQDETFIFCTHAHSWFLKDWDKILIETLQDVHKEGGHAISQFPLEASVEDNMFVFQERTPTTFPVFEAFRGGVPAFKGRFVENYNPRPFRVAMASYRCFFTSADVFVRHLALHDPGIPYLESPEADFLLSLELWTQGYHVFCPRYSVLVHNALDGEHFYSFKDVKDEPLKKIKKAIMQQLLHCVPDKDEPLAYVKKLQNREKHPIGGFCDWLGVNVKKKQVAGRTVMGLMEDFDGANIIQKYSSMERFERFKKQYTY